MSAPDPKAWEITDEDWEGISDKYGYLLGAKSVDPVIYSVARRRTIAELKALAKDMCQFCGKGTEFAVHPFEPETRFHNGEDRGFWECQCPEIHDRIAAIEAEDA